MAEGLYPSPDAVVVDCTLGGGGHSEALLEQLGPNGRLLGVDRDPDALAAATERLARFGERFVPVRGSFSDLRGTLDALSIDRVDAVVADLGVLLTSSTPMSAGFLFAVQVLWTCA